MKELLYGTAEQKYGSRNHLWANAENCSRYEIINDVDSIIRLISRPLKGHGYDYISFCVSSRWYPTLIVVDSEKIIYTVTTNIINMQLHFSTGSSSLDFSKLI